MNIYMFTGEHTMPLLLLLTYFWIYNTPMEPKPLATLIAEHDAAHAWLREYTPPVEVWRTLTSAPSSGLRWFRSSNVVDLETVRTLMRR
jgi:hypothetical protein